MLLRPARTQRRRVALSCAEQPGVHTPPVAGRCEIGHDPVPRMDLDNVEALGFARVRGDPNEPAPPVRQRQIGARHCCGRSGGGDRRRRSRRCSRPGPIRAPGRRRRRAHTWRYGLRCRTGGLLGGRRRTEPPRRGTVPRRLRPGGRGGGQAIMSGGPISSAAHGAQLRTCYQNSPPKVAMQRSLMVELGWPIAIAAATGARRPSTLRSSGRCRAHPVPPRAWRGWKEEHGHGDNACGTLAGRRAMNRLLAAIGRAAPRPSSPMAYPPPSQTCRDGWRDRRWAPQAVLRGGDRHLARRAAA